MLSLYFVTDCTNETYDDATTMREGDFYSLVFLCLFWFDKYLHYMHLLYILKETLNSYDNIICEQNVGAVRGESSGVSIRLILCLI